MIYALKKVDDHYQLVGIKDPPDGAVPGIPQINNQPTVPQTTIEPEQPQTIQPEETEQSQPEETEQPQQQTKTGGGYRKRPALNGRFCGPTDRTV